VLVYAFVEPAVGRTSIVIPHYKNVALSRCWLISHLPHRRSRKVYVSCCITSSCHL